MTYIVSIIKGFGGNSMYNNKMMAEMPYPEVEIDCPSTKDVKCIMDLYAGVDSELTAVIQYMYQSYIIGDKNEELHSSLEHIAMAEMKHMELLGECIVALGCTPVTGGNRQFWNGSMVNYNKDIVSILDINIKAEEKAIAGYKLAARSVDNYSVKELLERIEMDEKIHLEAFRAMKMKICVMK